MSINFFDEAHKSSSSKKLFGLCDDDSTPEAKEEPAYLSEDEFAREEEWIAEVSNEDTAFVDFHPIDKCVALKRPDGKDDNKCDCMLHYGDHIIFAELKERKDKKAQQWKKDACDQLQSTIIQFKTHHDFTAYKSVKAYICNKLRPAAVEPSSEMQQRFKDATNCILYIGRTIKIPREPHTEP